MGALWLRGQEDHQAARQRPGRPQAVPRGHHGHLRHRLRRLCGHGRGRPQQHDVAPHQVRLLPLPGAGRAHDAARGRRLAPHRAPDALRGLARAVPGRRAPRAQRGRDRRQAAQVRRRAPADGLRLRRGRRGRGRGRGRRRAGRAGQERARLRGRLRQGARRRRGRARRAPEGVPDGQRPQLHRLGRRQGEGRRRRAPRAAARAARAGGDRRRKA
mmetsp:Transcript_8792/g.26444  ORF Transcript_8792/g.26444 Transcript_8792/m.26444 type:complete len:215 (-) Transcript_8792:8-652(-)